MTMEHSIHCPKNSDRYPRSRSASRWIRLTGCALVLLAWAGGTCAPALAQVNSVERTVKGRAGQDIRIGVFASIRSDCKSGPLPTIKLKLPPAHGNVTVKQGKLRTTNFRQCLAAEVPAFIVIYKSKPEFSGSDAVVLEVINPAGKTQLQRITVTIDQGGGQPI
jgi:hypothetical protein